MGILLKWLYCSGRYLSNFVLRLLVDIFYILWRHFQKSQPQCAAIYVVLINDNIIHLLNHLTLVNILFILFCNLLNFFLVWFVFIQVFVVLHLCLDVLLTIVLFIYFLGLFRHVSINSKVSKVMIIASCVGGLFFYLFDDLYFRWCIMLNF